MTDGEEKSLDDILGESLGAAYDAAQAAPEGGEPPAAPSDAAPASGPQRDEHGRFTAKDPSQAAPSAPAPQNTDLGSKPGDGAAVQGPPSDAPASWSDAEKAIWKTLPPDVQAIIARREADFSKGLEQKTQGYRALDDVIAPRRDMLSRTYGSVENGIKELLGLSDFAVSQPKEFAKWFVHQHRLNPQEIFGGAPQGSSQGAPEQGQQGGEPPADPNAAVIAQIEEIKREVREIVNAPIVAKAQTDLQKFEAEAQTKYPHYLSNPRVKPLMQQVLLNGPDDQTFEQAYETAIWSIPELRQTLIDEKLKAQAEEQSRQAAEAARKARTTAGPQLRSVGALPEVRASKRGIDDTMSEVFDRMNGAA